MSDAVASSSIATKISGEARMGEKSARKDRGIKELGERFTLEKSRGGIESLPGGLDLQAEATQEKKLVSNSPGSLAD